NEIRTGESEHFQGRLSAGLELHNQASVKISLSACDFIFTRPLTCSHEIAHDFAWQCSYGQKELESDILFTRIAEEIWRDHTGDAKELVQVVADFLTERERHQAALLALEIRFTTLADANIHEHLEPIETYRDLLRGRLSTA
ncbi:hypothetical protein WDW37_21545, partial [Bdellovibrionota bacterium FG-1]